LGLPRIGWYNLQKEPGFVKKRVIRMGQGNVREQTAGLRGVVGLIVSAAVLCGCSLASSVGSSEDSPSFASRFTSFFSGATPGVTQPHSPTPSAPDVECPGVDIRTGASTLNVAAKAADATAGDLRYQISFGQTARECTVQGGAMSIKVGVQGRVILGPMGGPGQVGIPLRYAVVREGPQPKTIATKFKRTSVTVAPGQTHVQFVDIEEGLTFPVPPKAELDAYVVYVGFDEIGDQNEKKPPKSAKKPTTRQQ
jgi:hypothetical protein